MPVIYTLISLVSISMYQILEGGDGHTESNPVAACLAVLVGHDSGGSGSRSNRDGPERASVCGGEEFLEKRDLVSSQRCHVNVRGGG